MQQSHLVQMSTWRCELEIRPSFLFLWKWYHSYVRREFLQTRHQLGDQLIRFSCLRSLASLVFGLTECSLNSGQTRFQKLISVFDFEKKAPEERLFSFMQIVRKRLKSMWTSPVNLGLGCVSYSIAQIRAAVLKGTQLFLQIFTGLML